MSLCREKDPVCVPDPTVVRACSGPLMEKKAPPHPRWLEGGLWCVLDLHSWLFRGLGPGAGNQGLSFLPGSSVPLSGHMGGEGWVQILAYPGPACRSATGLCLGSLSASAPGRGSEGGVCWGVGLWTLESWENCERPGASREAGSDCTGKSFPCSRPPESHWELGLDLSPPRRGRGRGGAEGPRGGSLAGQPLP